MEQASLTAQSVVPVVEQEHRPLMRYKPLGTIVVGTGALVVPIDHPSTEYVSNRRPVYTSKVIAYDAVTGAFETKNIRYVLAKCDE